VMRLMLCALATWCHERGCNRHTVRG
jgi:hypothetical protein